MSNSNLFLALSKWAGARIENFSTEALAWLLDHQIEARKAFLNSSQTELSSKAGDAASKLVTQLVDSTSVQISTQKRLDIGGRRFQPDLWIEERQLGICCIIEVKVWSGTTYQVFGRDDEDEDNDRTADVEEGPSIEEYVAQTDSYRRWLDQEYNGKGILFLLSVGPEPELAERCHGTLTWTDVHREFRTLSGNESSLISEFCTFLEDQGMATVPLTRDDGMALGRTARCWVQWEQILNAIPTLLHDQLQKTDCGLSITIEGKSNMKISPGQRRLYLWTQYIEAQEGKTKLWLTPHLVGDGTRAIDPLRFALGVESDNNAKLRQIKNALAQSAKIEEIDTISGDETLYVPGVPADLFAQATLAAQAETLSTAAMEAIVRPILDVIRF